MNYYRVCPIGVISGKESSLTYHSEDTIEIGSVVSIPFGKRQKNGVVVSGCSKPDFDTKAITSRLPESITPQLIELGQWISDHYTAHMATVMQTILPSGLGKNRREPKNQATKSSLKKKLPDLTKDQKFALKQIVSTTETTLLHGVTGSGKTRIYQELAMRTLTKDKSVIVLVPEIALTPQLAESFMDITANVMVLHSGLTEAQRHIAWIKLREAREPWVVVGPRSALFSPLKSIGAIIIDECHEPSYHQDSPPKYSALRVARKRADIEKIDILLLGSATPNITDYTFAKSTNANIVELKNTVHEKNLTVSVVDITKRENFAKHPIFSNLLLELMNKSFVQNEQIMLFYNRRGTARNALCSSCGWHSVCSNCHLPMRLHQDSANLRCHICGKSEPLPQNCPVCKSPDIIFRGFGSKRIASEVRKLFPAATIARFDSDTPESEQLHKKYDQIKNGDIQILIGTQGIAKGLDLPNLRTVGLVQADSELFVPDFSSNERSFQLISQVIGRAGRQGHHSNVVVQTLNPDHPSIKFGISQDYHNFYNYELEERSLEHMPPYTYLLHLKIGYTSADYARKAAAKMKQSLKEEHPKIYIRGPAEAFHARRGSQYYYQLTVSSSSRLELVKITQRLPDRWSFTLDPLNLLG